MNLKIDLHVTHRCPCRCDHCFVSCGDVDLPEPSVAKLNDFFSHIASLGIKRIHFTGGEPFVRHDLEHIIEGAKSLGLMIKVITSGVGASRERIKTLSALGVEWVAVSLEAVTPEIHDTGKGFKGAHAAALDTLKNALEVGLQVEVLTLLTARNRQEMPELARVVAKMQVAKHSILYYSVVNRAAQHAHLQPSIETYEETVALMKKALQEVNSPGQFAIEIPQAVNNSPDTYACRIFKRTLAAILPDGRVYPCPLFVLSPLSLGNAWERPLGDIWNDEESWSAFSTIGTDLSSDCAVNACKGGCPAYTWLNTESLSGCDPRCRVRETGRVPSCVAYYIPI